MNPFNCLIKPQTLPKCTKPAISIKDIFCTNQEPFLYTTAASSILSNHQSPIESSIVSLLRPHYQIIGKTNSDSFSMGNTSTSSHFGKIKHPHYENRTPGGSSGGAAVSVLSGLCQVAIGSDTGGSIRMPAAYCGLVGYKPSYGRISRYGMIPYAPSLDTVGILAKEVGEVKKVFEVLDQYDEKDPSCLNQEMRVRFDQLDLEKRKAKRKLKIGLIQEYFPKEILENEKFMKRLKELIDELKDKVEFIDLSMPMIKYALSTYYIIASAEASSSMSKYSKNLPITPAVNRNDLEKEVQKRILLGTFVLSAKEYELYFHKAQQVRYLINAAYDEIFQQCDLLLKPCVLDTLPPLYSEKEDDLREYLNDVFTVGSSLAGLPSISVPYKDTSIQLSAAYGLDRYLLQETQQLFN